MIQLYDNNQLNWVPALNMLIQLKNGMEITEDPYVQHLKEIEAHDKYSKAILSRKTNSFELMRSLVFALCEIHNELGPWASQMYLGEYVTRYKSTNFEPLGIEQSVEERERDYLWGMLSQLEPLLSLESHEMGRDLISNKVEKLVDLLVDLIKPNSAGIVFVKTRAAVYALTELLRAHPRTMHLVRAGYFVGTSTYQSRSSKLAELLNVHDQKDNLNDLRSGVLNLIICTSVCEEGIDISACNFVIGFEPPPNVRAFIQRRGRARSKESKFVIMFNCTEQNRISEWQAVEREMMAAYMDDMRKLSTLEQLENEEEGYRELTVQATGYARSPQEMLLR